MDTSWVRRVAEVAVWALAALAIAAWGFKMEGNRANHSARFMAGFKPSQALFTTRSEAVPTDYRIGGDRLTLHQDPVADLALPQTNDGSLNGQCPHGVLRNVSANSSFAMAQAYQGDYDSGASTGLMALLGGSILFILFLGLAIYVYFALAISTIAKKTNHGGRWMAWFPILDVILMLRIAGKPLWWILLFLIPFVNLVILVVVWMGMAKARKKPEWWGVFILVPVVDFILPGVLAFTE